MAGVNIVTTQFAEAANAQCEALGYDASIVYVPHPIQNRTRAELEVLADQHFEAILSQLGVPNA